MDLCPFIMIMKLQQTKCCDVYKKIVFDYKMDNNTPFWTNCNTNRTGKLKWSQNAIMNLKMRE
jgi:hypothetical protein